MTGPDDVSLPEDLAQLILEHIESVPHVEALMLVCENAPRAWSAVELRQRTYVSVERVQVILRDLQRRGFLEVTTQGEERYTLTESSEARSIALRIVDAYRRNVFQVSTLIHSRAPQAVREFARAFDIRKKP